MREIHWTGLVAVKSWPIPGVWSTSGLWVVEASGVKVLSKFGGFWVGFEVLG